MDNIIYRDINIEKNTIKWYTKLMLLGFLAILIWGGEYIGIMSFIYLGIVLTVSKWGTIIRFFFGKDFFLYDGQGILKYKIGKYSGSDILFVDIIDLGIDDTMITFAKEIKRTVRKNKQEKFLISLQGLKEEDVNQLKTIFNENSSNKKSSIETSHPTPEKKSNSPITRY